MIATFTMLSPADAKTFRWAYQGDAAEMDYQARRETFTDAVIANMMEGMIRYNGKLELEPSLAEKWELLSPTVWRFFLRKGVKFHNGNPFNADDVIATFKRGSDKRSPWKGSLFPVKDMKAYERPAETLPRVKGHHWDWLNAIKTGTKAGSDIPSYGGPLTELAQLGIIAYHFPQQKLLWDGPNMRFTNNDDANKLIKPEFRKGWSL